MLFGGFEDITYEKNDLHLFDLENMKWLCIERETLKRKHFGDSRLSKSVSTRLNSDKVVVLPKIESIGKSHHSNSLGSIKYSPVKILPSKMISSLQTSSPSKFKKRQTLRTERQSTSMSSIVISNSDRIISDELTIPAFQTESRERRPASTMRKPTFLDNLKTIQVNPSFKHQSNGNSRENSGMMNSVDTESRVRVIEAKKMMMLSEFEVDESLKNSLLYKSPTTELMKRAIQSVTNMPFKEEPLDAKKKRKV